MTDRWQTHTACREYLGLVGWCPAERAPDSAWCEAHTEDRRQWRIRTYGGAQ